VRETQHVDRHIVQGIFCVFGANRIRPGEAEAIDQPSRFVEETRVDLQIVGRASLEVVSLRVARNEPVKVRQRRNPYFVPLPGLGVLLKGHNWTVIAPFLP
jgi:hypothetical protein